MVMPMMGNQRIPSLSSNEAEGFRSGADVARGAVTPGEAVALRSACACCGDPKACTADEAAGATGGRAGGGGGAACAGFAGPGGAVGTVGGAAGFCGAAAAGLGATIAGDRNAD